MSFADRRRFLALCGGAVAGIWLAGSGFMRLERRMVLKLSGPCSFCGKKSEEVFGLAGIAERDITICDECAQLCLDIIAEEKDKDAQSAQAPQRSRWTEPDDLDALMSAESDLAEAQRRADAIREALDSARTARRRERRNIHLSCSFCDRSQKEVAKLIAGPTVYICDGCIGDVASILLGQRMKA